MEHNKELTSLYMTYSANKEENNGTREKEKNTKT